VGGDGKLKKWGIMGDLLIIRGMTLTEKVGPQASLSFFHVPNIR
jgi:hypothetical protein